ncbi:MAG: cache domain-containing protein [Deltaproteobacteria bacterium]|nr:cache domain-containing protein [Deltaproteobacteria bacterium]
MRTGRAAEEIVEQQLDHLKWMTAIGSLSITGVYSPVFNVAPSASRWLVSPFRNVEKTVPSTAETFKEIERIASLSAQEARLVASLCKPSHPGFIVELQSLTEKKNFQLSEIGPAIEQEEGTFISSARLIKNIIAHSKSILHVCERDPSLGSDEERKTIAKTTIKNLRYDPAAKDYLWIINTNNEMVMHPYHTEFYNSDLSSLKDSAGTKPFVEMTELCRKGDGGCLFYQWPRYDEYKGESPKFAFVSYFDSWYWIIGTGLYVDEQDHELLNRIHSFLQGNKSDILPGGNVFKTSFEQFHATAETKALLQAMPALTEQTKSIQATEELFDETVHKIQNNLAALDIEVALKLYSDELSNLARRANNLLAAIRQEEMRHQPDAAQAATIFHRDVEPQASQVAGHLCESQRTVEQKTGYEGVVVKRTSDSKLTVCGLLTVSAFATLFGAVIVTRTEMRLLNSLSDALECLRDGMIHVSAASVRTEKNLAAGIDKQANSVKSAASSLNAIASQALNNLDGAEAACRSAAAANHTSALLEESWGKISQGKA